MGFKEKIIGTINAALSPNQMTRQYSKPGKIGTQEVWDGLTYQKEGLTYQDYDEMLLDPQIKSGYELIRMFLLSRKIVIIPYSDKVEDKEVAEQIEEMLHSMDYPLRKVRNDMYSAIIYGYSVSEKIFDYDSENEQILGIKRIRPIPIDTLSNCFEYDKYGDLKQIIQYNGTSGKQQPIPAEKCLVYTYDERFGDRSGNSILDSVYDNWYVKQKLMSWWNIYLQKLEGPVLVGKVAIDNQKDAMRLALEDVKEGRTQITIGKDDEVKTLESQHRGEGFKDAINYHDITIFRKMNIGTLIMGQENGSGAYAQSKTQFDTLSIFLDGVHEDVAAELQIMINEICELNWPNIRAPRIGFETFEEKDLLLLIEKLGGLISNMAVNPSEKWFKQLLAEVVNKYSNIDMSSLTDENELPQIIPTLEEQRTEVPQHQELVTNIVNTIQPREQV